MIWVYPSVKIVETLINESQPGNILAALQDPIGG